MASSGSARRLWSSFLSSIPRKMPFVVDPKLLDFHARWLLAPRSRVPKHGASGTSPQPLVEISNAAGALQQSPIIRAAPCRPASHRREDIEAHRQAPRGPFPGRGSLRWRDRATDREGLPSTQPCGSETQTSKSFFHPLCKAAPLREGHTGAARLVRQEAHGFGVVMPRVPT